MSVRVVRTAASMDVALVIVVVLVVVVVVVVVGSTVGSKTTPAFAKASCTTAALIACASLLA